MAMHFYIDIQEEKSIFFPSIVATTRKEVQWVIYIQTHTMNEHTYIQLEKVLSTLSFADLCCSASHSCIKWVEKLLKENNRIEEKVKGENMTPEIHLYLLFIPDNTKFLDALHKKTMSMKMHISRKNA